MFIPAFLLAVIACFAADNGTVDHLLAVKIAALAFPLLFAAGAYFTLKYKKRTAEREEKMDSGE